MNSNKPVFKFKVKFENGHASLTNNEFFLLISNYIMIKRFLSIYRCTCSKKGYVHVWNTMDVDEPERDYQTLA